MSSTLFLIVTDVNFVDGGLDVHLLITELSLGAGGAVTWLSDRDGEWDEVLTKVKSVVGKLEGVP